MCVHLFVIAWQSRILIAQSIHSMVSVTSPGMLPVTTCARRVKQESNCSFFEQFFSRGFFRGSCDINSGMSSKHFCRDLRGFDVGGKWWLTFGNSVGTGWLQRSYQQHCGWQELSTNRSGFSLSRCTLISLHGLAERHLYFGMHCLKTKD